MEWIYEHLLGSCLPSAYEMSGHADPNKGQSQSLADQQVDHAERNGYSPAEIHHPVEVAVLRVEVVDFVANEAELVKKHLVESIYGDTRSWGVAGNVADPVSPVIELGLESIDIDSGIARACEFPDPFLEIEVFTLGEDKREELGVMLDGGAPFEHLEDPPTDHWFWMQGVLLNELQACRTCRQDVPTDRFNHRGVVISEQGQHCLELRSRKTPRLWLLGMQGRL